MKEAKRNRTQLVKLLVVLATTSLALSLQAQQAEVAAHVAALKASVAASQKALRQYEYIETTIVSVKGEEKSQEVDRCYYGADGALQKVPITTPPPPKKKFGLRGRIAAREQKEMNEYMKNAVALAKQYVPPQPKLVQSAKDKGKASVDVLEPGKRVRLDFHDYLKPGDNLGVEMDLTSNRLLALTVASHMEKEKDVIHLTARFATLDDGSSYPAVVTLDAPAKKLELTIKHSGYRKTP